jgi:hypothetical protein
MFIERKNAKAMLEAALVWASLPPAAACPDAAADARERKDHSLVPPAAVAAWKKSGVIAMLRTAALRPLHAEWREFLTALAVPSAQMPRLRKRCETWASGPFQGGRMIFGADGQQHIGEFSTQSAEVLLGWIGGQLLVTGAELLVRRCDECNDFFAFPAPGSPDRKKGVTPNTCPAHRSTKAQSTSTARVRRFRERTQGKK